MKNVKLFFLLVIICVIFCACTVQRGIILFNKEPITRGNIKNDSKVFSPGERVYYIFIAPKKIKDEFIRVQIFKMTDLAPWGGNEVLRTKDYRLMMDERYYHTNYFTLYENGRYVMQVFSHNDFQHPLAINDFYIK